MNYLKQRPSIPSTSNSRGPYSRPNSSGLFKTPNRSSASSANYGRIFVTRPTASRNSASNQHHRNLSFSDDYNDHVPLTESYPPSNISTDIPFQPGEFRSRAGQSVPFQELETMSIVSDVTSVSRRTKTTQESSKSDSFQIKVREHSLRIFSGSVTNLFHWYKLTDKYHMMFEVTAALENVQTGKWSTEKILNLTDSKTGPRMQVFFYEIDRSLPALTVPSVVRCVGRLLARNRLHAFKVEESSEEERSAGQRLAFICNRVAEELTALHQQNKK